MISSSTKPFYNDFSRKMSSLQETDFQTTETFFQQWREELTQALDAASAEKERSDAALGIEALKSALYIVAASRKIIKD